MKPLNVSKKSIEKYISLLKRMSDDKKQLAKLEESIIKSIEANLGYYDGQRTFEECGYKITLITKSTLKIDKDIEKDQMEWLKEEGLVKEKSITKYSPDVKRITNLLYSDDKTSAEKVAACVVSSKAAPSLKVTFG